MATTAKLLRTSDVAELIGYEARTIRNWCESDVFPTAQKIPATSRGQWRIKADDVALQQMLAGEDASELLLTGYQEQITGYLQQLDEQDQEIVKLMEKVTWYENNFPAYRNRVHQQEQQLSEQAALIQQQQAQLDKYAAWHERQRQQQEQRQRRAT